MQTRNVIQFAKMNEIDKATFYWTLNAEVTSVKITIKFKEHNEKVK